MAGAFLGLWSHKEDERASGAFSRKLRGRNSSDVYHGMGISVSREPQGRLEDGTEQLYHDFLSFLGLWSLKED
jgi:hypothetical protein